MSHRWGLQVVYAFHFLLYFTGTLYRWKVMLTLVVNQSPDWLVFNCLCYYMTSILAVYIQCKRFQGLTSKGSSL